LISKKGKGRKRSKRRQDQLLQVKGELIIEIWAQVLLRDPCFTCQLAKLGVKLRKGLVALHDKAPIVMTRILGFVSVNVDCSQVINHVLGSIKASCSVARGQVLSSLTLSTAVDINLLVLL
jgi:hypothetical protein